jgi:succinyl-CoA synthetase beta subunit
VSIAAPLGSTQRTDIGPLQPAEQGLGGRQGLDQGARRKASPGSSPSSAACWTATDGALQVEKTLGTLTHFIIEPFLPHPADSEFYICINSVREGDVVLFTHEGGVEVGDVDAKALTLLVPVGGELPDRETIKKDLLGGVVGEERKDALVDFLSRLYSVYVELHFAYLEINPLVAVEVKGKTEIFYLDMAAKLDQVRPISYPTTSSVLTTLAVDCRVYRWTQVGHRS